MSSPMSSGRCRVDGVRGASLTWSRTTFLCNTSNMFSHCVALPPIGLELYSQNRYVACCCTIWWLWRMGTGCYLLPPQWRGHSGEVDRIYDYSSCRLVSTNISCLSLKPISYPREDLNGFTIDELSIDKPILNFNQPIFKYDCYQLTTCAFFDRFSWVTFHWRT